MDRENMLNLDELMSGSTKESAYTLGFIWGDGYLLARPDKSLHTIVIKIITDDMKEISPIIQSTGHWTEASQCQINRKPQSILTVCNKKLVNYLLDNGYGPNTSGSASNILSKIETQLLYARSSLAIKPLFNFSKKPL